MGTAVKRFWMTLCAVIMWFSATLWSVNAWAEATPSEGVAPAYKVDVVVVGSISYIYYLVLIDQF